MRVSQPGTSLTCSNAPAVIVNQYVYKYASAHSLMMHLNDATMLISASRRSRIQYILKLATSTHTTRLRDFRKNGQEVHVIELPLIGE